MTERLRVAYTLEQCWHRVPGGTAVAALGMARALERRPDVELVGYAARHLRSPREPWVPPLEVRSAALPRQALYESWMRLRRPHVERATGPVAVIHATTIAMPPATRPVVMTIHDVAFIVHPETFTKRGLRFFHANLKIALDEAAIVLCSSRSTLDGCRSAGFEDARLRLVPLGIDARPASELDVARVRRTYDLSGHYILFAGTVEPRKNLRGLLSAYARLDGPPDLVIAGPKGWSEDLGSLVAPARGKVRVLGFVPAADLPGLYAGAAVFCYPSLLEGFGFPVLEAMAQGTPVVTSMGTSTEELAGDAGVLIDPRQPDTIAAGIESVLNDEALARRLAAAGRKRVAAYTWAATAEGVARAYVEVAR